MKTIKIIQENIFQKIATALALAKIKKELPKAMKEVENDPRLTTSLQNFEYHANELAKVLPDYCKRRPDSQLCKDNAAITGKDKATGK